MDTATRQTLIDEALRSRHNAYARFSNFLVGAAVLTSEGQIFSGVNVENSSYGLTCCAERTAIFSAVAAGHREFAAIAVASAGGCAPCGACRQVMVEFGADIQIFLVDADQPDRIEETTVAQLLPHAFRFDGA